MPESPTSVIPANPLPSFPLPYLRHSRERGNLSPAWCAITTPEAVRHAGLAE